MPLDSVIAERVESNRRIADERWRSHEAFHVDLAKALYEYKRSANEWRATLNDFRSTGVSRDEYTAEHKLLEARLCGDIGKLATRLDALEHSFRSAADRDKAIRDSLNAARNTIVLGLAIIAGLIGFEVWLR